MPKVLLSLSLVLLTGLVSYSPVFSLPAQAAESNISNRKNISIFQRQDIPLNKTLRQALQKEFPGFEFNFLGNSGEGDLTEFLQEIERFKSEQSEDNVARQDNETLRFGDRYVTWGDTKRLMSSAYVLAPNWNYGEIELTGPHALGPESDRSWVLRAEAPLTLDLELLPLGSESIQASHISEGYRVKRDIPIPELSQVLPLVEKVTGSPVDINNPDDQARILDVLKKLSSFQNILQQNPAEYFASEVSAAVSAKGFRSLFSELKQQPAFAAGSSSNQQASNSSASKEPFLGFTLRGGTYPIWLNGPASQFSPPQAGQFFVPGGQLDVSYNFGQHLGWSETYVFLSGGVTAPVGLSLFDLQQMQAIPSDIIAQTATALGITSELGLSKRWFLGNWTINAGLSGGALFGILSGISMQQFPITATQTGFGGTLRVGAEYQITPNFLLGLDTGFRYYFFPSSAFPANAWSSSSLTGFPQPINFNAPLASFGPLILLNATYTF